MSRVIYQLQQRAHTFGDEAPSGWFPPPAGPPRTPKRTVMLDISVEEVDGGYILEWSGPSPEYSGDHWYQDLAYAEHAAEELFGITRSNWVHAV